MELSKVIKFTWPNILKYADSDYDVKIYDEFFSDEHYSTLAAENELYSEKPDKRALEYITRLLTLLDENRIWIDKLIEKYSRGWRPDRIAKTALAVMRCAVCEIMYMDDIPNASAINEAVELDKGYDEPDVVSFVNGVLGGIVRGELSEKTAE